MAASLKNFYDRTRYSFCLNIRKRSFVEVSFKNQMKEHKILEKTLLQFLKLFSIYEMGIFLYDNH